MLVALGAGWVVLGGLAAAVTGPLDWSAGSWVAAYLVLVCGTAQCVFGEVHSRLTQPAPAAIRWVSLVAWNLGNLAVIAGVLARIAPISDAGGVMLVVALIAELRSAGGTRHRLLAGWYRTLLIILIISIPVGLVLGHVRAA